MNRSVVAFLACASAFCAPFAVCAQEESDAEASSGGQGGDAGQADVQNAPAKPQAAYFHTLVRLVSLGDGVTVKLPRQETFEPAVAGKYYPNGSAFRISTAESRPAVFEFGQESFVKAFGETEFASQDVPAGERSRAILFSRGSLSLSLPRTLPTGMFSVCFPNFTAKDLAGESRCDLAPSGDGDEAVVHVITGMLALDGCNYRIGRMSAADRIRIRTTEGALFTSLRGEAGDYKVTLDQGVLNFTDPVSGAMKEKERTLDYSLTPQCAIKIFRKRAKAGGRMAVSVMTFDASGEMRNRFTFAEGSPKINFGEEVVRIADISFKTKSGKDEAKAGGDSDGGKAPEGGSAEESQSGDSGSESSGSGDSGGDSGFGGF